MESETCDLQPQWRENQQNANNKHLTLIKYKLIVD